MMENSTHEPNTPGTPKVSNTYLSKLEEKAEKITAYKELVKFCRESQTLDPSPAMISLVHFNHNSPLKVDEFTEDDLEENLKHLEPGELFVIENISKKVIELLGPQLDVEDEFWLDHVSNSNWFRLEKIEKHLPALKSVQLESRHLRHRCISPRELKLEDPSKLDERIEPKHRSTRVRRVAGALKPLERVPDRSHKNASLEEDFRPFALTRQHISMWFDASEGSKEWKIGIILLDPEFQPEATLGTCQLPSYRSFFRRDESDEKMTHRTSFISCLKQDPVLKANGIPPPFVILGDLYRIIASEWVVVNTCFERELNTIEWNLENDKTTSEKLETLHEYLNRLYVIRRRITLYEMLVKEQLEACHQRGRKHWNQDASASDHQAIETTASTLETDFTFVSNLVEKNQERVAKNINLIIALISVAESYIGITNGKRMETLTVAAIFFLPFSIVSSVMSIKGDLGTGQSRQSIFWAVTVPSSLTLLCIYMLYRSHGRRKLKGKGSKIFSKLSWRTSNVRAS